MVLIKVNDYEVTEQEFVSEVYKLCSDRGVEQPDREIIEKAANNLIDGFIVLDEARKQNITVEDDDVEKEMLNLMMTFESPDKYNDYLQVLKSSPALLKEHLRNKLLINRYICSHFDKCCGCDEESLRKFYEDNIELFFVDELIRVSHILIKPEMGIEKALQVREKIKTEEDFNRVVSCCSNCPSCSQAGDLGYISKGKMVTQFEEVAFKLGIKEISQPVETVHGYHIIMLTDRKRGVTLPFKEVKETLKKRLIQIEKELGTVKLIEELKEKAEIYISDEVWEIRL